jgi:hypothetical protein
MKPAEEWGEKVEIISQQQFISFKLSHQCWKYLVLL